MPSDPVVFTDDELEAVNSTLELYGDVAKQHSPFGAEGTCEVPIRVKYGMVAQGLWYYADQLITTTFVNEFSQSEIDEQFRKAATALIKSLRFYQVPIVSFHIGVLAASLGLPNWPELLSGFLRCQSTFVPDEIDKIFTDQMEGNFALIMNWDVKTAIAQAKEALIDDAVAKTLIRLRT